MSDDVLRKKCKKCGEEKPLDQFYAAKETKDGRHGSCRACYDARVNEWRKNNRDKQKASDEKWREDHPERIRRKREREKDGLRGSGKYALRSRAFRANHPEQNKAHRLLKVAVKSGKISKPLACESCGRIGKIQGHHHDYSLPLDVRWLCRPCHVLADAERRRLECQQKA